MYVYMHTNLESRNTNLLPPSRTLSDSRFKIQDSRFKIQDSRRTLKKIVIRIYNFTNIKLNSQKVSVNLVMPRPKARDSVLYYCIWDPGALDFLNLYIAVSLSVLCYKCCVVITMPCCRYTFRIILIFLLF